MSLFGFGTPSELSTPIGVMVKSATDSLRIGPDWTKNMEICDQINLHRDNIEPAIKAIRRRLMDNDQQTVALSLTLLETCMKNCGADFARRFDRSLMDEVVNIVIKDNKGIHNREEALRLIQQWGRAFEARKAVYPIFFDTFMSLKARGVSFPKEDENVTTGFETTTNSSANASAQRSAFSIAPTSAPQQSASSPAQEEDEFIRLQQDLSVVMEKVRLCREMLLVSPGIKQDEALADVVGFLEACRDRLVDIIEAGTQGLLGEELFELILKVNDAVARTLESERTGVRIPVDDEESSEGKKSEVSSSMDVSLIDLSPSTPPPQAHFTVDEDLFAEKYPAPVVTTPYYGEIPMSVPIAAPSTTLLEDYVAVPPPPPARADFSSRPLPPIDDFDALFAGTPASTGNAAPLNNSTAKESELEDFFASLDVQK